MGTLAVEDWGIIEYRAALARQHALVEARRAAEIPDTLVLCEHPAVVTLGRKTPADAPRPTHVPVVEVERGGEATWHGPGQLVGYPIVDLEPRGRDVHGFLRGLEAALAHACADLGVPAGARTGETGLFVDDARAAGGFRKVCSIGIAVRRWVTYHGFALNITAGAAAYAGLHPCGFQPEVMAGLADFVRPAPTREAVAERVVARLSEVLGVARELRPAPSEGGRVR